MLSCAWSRVSSIRVLDVDAASAAVIRDEDAYAGVRVSMRAQLAYRRHVELAPLAQVLDGYGDIGQQRWAAWP